MKLLNSLYHIVSREEGIQTVRYDIRLDANHIIYQAHFPGEPITPGVCILQIAKELLEDYLHKPLSIQSIKNAKFLSVISPVETPQVSYVYEKIIINDTAFMYNVTVLVLSDVSHHHAKLSFTCKQQ